MAILKPARERIEHLIKLRDLQSLKSENHYGFITFIPWPFQDEGTVLRRKYGIRSSYTGPDYLRMIAVSRIILNNIRNIQASILTVGKEIGMLSLHAGANDLGSIMIEENVVSAAGAKNRFNAEEMQSIITGSWICSPTGEIRNMNLYPGALNRISPPAPIILFSPPAPLRGVLIYRLKLAPRLGGI